MTETHGSRDRIVSGPASLFRGHKHLLSQPSLLELLPVSWSRALFSLGLVTQAGVCFVNEQGPTGELRELLVILFFFFFNYSPLLSRKTSTLSQGVT